VAKLVRDDVVVGADCGVAGFANAAPGAIAIAVAARKEIGLFMEVLLACRPPAEGESRAGTTRFTLNLRPAVNREALATAGAIASASSPA